MTRVVLAKQYISYGTFYLRHAGLDNISLISPIPPPHPPLCFHNVSPAPYSHTLQVTLPDAQIYSQDMKYNIQAIRHQVLGRTKSWPQAPATGTGPAGQLGATYE